MSRRRPAILALAFVVALSGGCVRAARTQMAAVTAPAMHGGAPGSASLARASRSRSTEIIVLGGEE